MKLVGLRCPNCGGNLTVENGMYVCNSCGSTTAIDYDDSDVEYERLKTEAERDEKQRIHEKEMLEREYELREKAQIESEKRQIRRDRKAEANSWIKRLIAIMIFVGFCITSVVFYNYIRNQIGYSDSSYLSEFAATPTPAPNYNVTSEDFEGWLDDFIKSGKKVQMKIDQCSTKNNNGVVHFYDKVDAVFLDAYLLSGIPDKPEKESCRLVLIYEVTWHNDDYGDQICYDAVYFDGIRVNPNGGIISDYSGKMINRSDAAWGWAMAYSYEEYDQCFRENITALGGKVTKLFEASVSETAGTGDTENTEEG